MTKAQVIFEAIMRSKGHVEFSKTASGKYKMSSTQVRWAYFQVGWEMRGALQ
jgi:hypothetical protein